MEECPSYSHKSRDKAKADSQKSEKRVAKAVVTGNASTKKKSEIRKFADGFVSEDAANVKSYILQDVIIPAAKRILDDVIVGSLRMFLYGDKGSSGGSRSNASKVSYRSYYERESDRRRDSGSGRGRSGFEYDDIEFEYRGDAEAVLTEMENIIESEYQMASVADLYDLAGVSNNNPSTNRYGWTNLATATVARTRDGKYVIKLPRAMPLN